jgi:glycosyltransferase involved in cell wall biosynthesis
MAIHHLIAPGPTGGAERLVLTGVRGLVARGVPVTLHVLRDGRAAEAVDSFVAQARQAPEPPQIRVHPTSGAFDMGFVPALARRLRAESSPPMLHAHGHKAVLAASLLGALVPGLRTVATHHGTTAHTARQRLNEHLMRWAYGGFDRVVAVTDADLPPLERSAGARVRLVENCLSAPVAMSAPRPHVESDRLRLAFIGRLSPEKGAHVLLEALNDPLLERQFELSIHGDGPERAALEQYAVAHRLPVRFHGFTRDIAAALVASDVVVMPSLREGLPLTAIEARVAGRVLVASSVGALPGLVRNGVDGALCPAGDVGALRGVLHRATREFPRWQDGARQGQPAFARRFSLDRWLDETCDLYSELTGAGRAQGVSPAAQRDGTVAHHIGGSPHHARA